MQIRKGGPADEMQIMALLGRVFEGEQGIPRALNAIPGDRMPQWWCLEEEGTILGSVALFREEGAWHMGRFAIDPALRGQHWGTRLLEAALSDVFQQDIHEVSMEVRDTTAHILKQFGAEVTGAPFAFYQGQVTPMKLTRTAYRQSRSGCV